MRTRPLASLIWLLVPAILGFFPLHAAFGATLTWQKLPKKEVLVFKFESRLPSAEPRQRGLTQVQIPIPWSFWQKERKPRNPAYSESSLIKEMTITQDGVFIQTRSDDFVFSSSTDPKLKTLTLEFYPPVQDEEPKPQNGTREQAGETEELPGNATQTNASVPDEPAQTLAPLAQDNETQPVTPAQPDSAEASRNTTALSDQTPSLPPAPSFLSGASTLRSKIMRPGQEDPQQAGTEATAISDFQVRRPIDRSAPPSLQAQNTTAIETAPSAGSPPAQNQSAALPAGNAELPQVDADTTATAQRESVDSPPAIMPEGAAVPAQVDAPQPAPEDLATQTTAEKRAAGTDVGPAQAAPEKIQPEPEPQAQNNSLTALNATTQDNGTLDNSTAELETLYKTAQTALMTGDIKNGRAAVTAMIEHPKAPAPLREELLYTLADIVMQEGKEDMEGNFTAILDAYEEAKYSNPNSPNVPEALSRIGYLHLSVGNVPEAKGYFDLLRRKYPDNPRVAMIDYYWGEHYLRRKEYARAAEHFQYVVQNFPMSAAVQPSTVGLLKAFTELGFFEKAMEIVNSIEKRWPKYYLSDPSFLMAAGYAAMLSGNLDRAKDFFWAYTNIVPQAPDVDVAMARIGDIHLKQGKSDSAREIYHRTAEAYPDREGGLIAQMRLAEEGVLDAPSIADMDPVFGRSSANPEQIYSRILEHADSPLAPVARLKLAMWQLWNKKFADSLESIHRFQEDYPGHELLPKAREVADKALRDWIMQDLDKKDYAGAAQHWTDHEHMYQGRELDPQIRLVLATAFMQTGQLQKALDMAKPFVFGGIPRGEFSEAGLDLTLAMLVDLQQWRDILELATRVAPWNLGIERQRQVDYAAALAHEKLDQPTKAKPLWTKLATDVGLTDTQRGYAHYFLGRGAMISGDMEQASILGQEALELLKKEKADLSKIKETLELLVQAADRSGRSQEALAWSLEYDDYVSEDDRDWPAHTYRKAMLYKKNGEMKKWSENLNRLRELFPNSLHGRMAAAELEGVRLEKEAGKFR